jgi:hypothetical protein
MGNPLDRTGRLQMVEPAQRGGRGNARADTGIAYRKPVAAKLGNIEIEQQIPGGIRKVDPLPQHPIAHTPHAHDPQRRQETRAPVAISVTLRNNFIIHAGRA